MFSLLTGSYDSAALPSECAPKLVARKARQEDSWDQFRNTDAASFDTDKPFQLMVHGITKSESLLENPVISKTESISVSIISREKPMTFSNSGVVIKASPSNILKTHPSDIMLRLDRSAPLVFMGPREVLNKSESPRWNEVVIRGNETDNPEVVGYFVIISAEGKPLISQGRLERIKHFSEQNGLPIFYVRDPERTTVQDSFQWD